MRICSGLMKLTLRIIAEVLLIAAIVLVIWATWLPSLSVGER